MLDIITVRQKLKDLGCCVIIPTYNNASTLPDLITGVRNYSGDIIVIDDGSTDATPAILAGLAVNNGIVTVRIPVNRGKGFALRTGFRFAVEKGYRYAITIDSDGQHFADDIPAFATAAEENPESLILGARNMDQKGIPGTSTFGHRFSIFWFRVETGLKVEDVQTGFRLYPLTHVARVRRFFTTRFEFEVEILVRLAWRGVNIMTVPVNVYYAPKGERVSHFRKGPDFARTSLLNTILVFAALLWVRPFHYAKGLRKKSWKEFFRETILNSSESNAKIAWSVTVGVYVGVMPFWGWQTLLALGLAYLFKLNKAITIVASNISLPPMIPFILFGSFFTGGWVLGNDISGLQFTSGIDFNWIKRNLVQYVVGSFVFGLVLAPLIGLITRVLLGSLRKKR